MSGSGSWPSSCSSTGAKVPTQLSPYESSSARQLVGIGRQEALGPQFRRGQPDVAHLGEHAVRGELVAPARHLAHTPRDRRACDFHRDLTSSIRTGTPRCNDSVAASASHATSTASATVHAGRGGAVDHVDERGQLGAERVGEAVHEEVVRRPGGKLVVGIDISHRHALVPAGDHGVVEAVHLQPAVVAVAVVAGRGHHPERALVERHHAPRRCRHRRTRRTAGRPARCRWRTPRPPAVR